MTERCVYYPAISPFIPQSNAGEGTRPIGVIAEEMDLVSSLSRHVYMAKLCMYLAGCLKFRIDSQQFFKQNKVKKPTVREHTNIVAAATLICSVAKK